MNTCFVEVCSENSKEYLGKILKLQDEVFENLRKQEKQHLFFKSSEEEISEYIESENSLVAIIKNKDEIASVCYFTFNHSVYNNLTLYIKNSSAYRDFAFSTYTLPNLASKYMHNIKAYALLKENGILSDNILNTIREKAKNNDFFENDPLRQEISKLLMDNNILNDIFYPWILSTDLPKMNIDFHNLSKEYDEFISYFGYKYIVSPKVISPKLADLTDNVVGELDTYFSSPKYRNQGYASSLINWAIKKAMSKKDIVAMSATVHPENLISQHILKNLGFETFCTVERRKGILRDIMFKLID